MKLVFVGGAQGAGKSSLVALAAQKLKEEGVSVFHLDPGEFIREYCARKKLGRFSDLDFKEQMRVNRAVLKEVKPVLSKHDLVFVSTHYAVNTVKSKPDELIDVPLRMPLAEPLVDKASHLVLLDVDPEEVHRRIRGDSRRPNTWEDVSRSVIANKLSARALAKTRKLPLTVIHNNRDLQKETIGELVKIAKEVIRK